MSLSRHHFLHSLFTFEGEKNKNKNKKRQKKKTGCSSQNHIFKTPHSFGLFSLSQEDKQSLTSNVVVVVMAPTIYGVGSGLFNKHSIQIPAFVATSLDHGRAVVIGDGEGVWDHVHVQDLAALYEILARRALDKGQGLPWGKKGIIFAGTGRHSWGDVARSVARAGLEAGVLPDAPVEHLSLADAAKLFAKSYLGEPDEFLIEVGLASSGRTIPTVALGLGWKPVKGKEDWERGFREDMDAVLKERREKGR